MVYILLKWIVELVLLFGNRMTNNLACWQKDRLMLLLMSQCKFEYRSSISTVPFKKKKKFFV